MSALLEQYFQTIVVDRIDEVITKQCQGIKNNLEAECNEIKDKINRLEQLKTNYNNLCDEIEDLKKMISVSMQVKLKSVNTIVKKEATKAIKKAVPANKSASPKKVSKK